MKYFNKMIVSNCKDPCFDSTKLNHRQSRIAASLLRKISSKQRSRDAVIASYRARQHEGMGPGRPLHGFRRNPIIPATSLLNKTRAASCKMRLLYI